MARQVHFKGSPLTLTGKPVNKGAVAPDFNVTRQDLSACRLSDCKGKAQIFTTFPSLDTPVCDLQVKEFNKKAAGLSSDVVIVGISKDLPFAQARFCQDNEIKNVTILSDYKSNSFGLNYGLLIEELQLLARAVIIVDKKDIVRYVQIVDELTTQPDYDDVINNLKEILKGGGS
jgi:thiol peroxidase